MIVLNKLPKLTFWRAVLVVILGAGFYSTLLRYSQGLGAATAMSDRFPWGLWVGFDVLCGVGLAAGGFTIAGVVYIFHLERFRPILRPTILTAFLGYGLVAVGLLFDLGRPYRIWHPMIMWNPRSVMFEVAWCVMLYLTVLALEFSPVVFERFGFTRPTKIMHAITIPLVMAGVLLSTLHQSSLGSLYLIVPAKLHPFWYSSSLPVYFFVSAIAVGLAMVIFESHLTSQAFGHEIPLPLLSDLSKVMVVVLGIYGLIRFQDLLGSGALHYLLVPSQETLLFALEIVLGLAAPVAILVFPRMRRNREGLFGAAVMVIAGFVLNRLNVAITGLEGFIGGTYYPKWTEVAVTLSLTSAGILAFALAAKYFNLFGEHAPAGAPRKAVQVYEEVT